MTLTAHAKPRHSAACLLIMLGMLAGRVFGGDYRDDVGYTRLQAELGVAVPTGTGVAVTQTEASSGGFNYMPDVSSAEFTGKTIYAKSTPGGVTGHATTVAAYFYGLASSMAPDVNSIDVFEAENWLHSGFLRRTTMSHPNVEIAPSKTTAGSAISTTAVWQMSRPCDGLDFAIERDDFLAVWP